MLFHLSPWKHPLIEGGLELLAQRLDLGHRMMHRRACVTAVSASRTSNAKKNHKDFHQP